MLVMAELACWVSLHLKLRFQQTQGATADPSKLILYFSVMKVVSKTVLTKFQQNYPKNTANKILKVNISLKK